MSVDIRTGLDGKGRIGELAVADDLIDIVFIKGPFDELVALGGSRGNGGCLVLFLFDHIGIFGSSTAALDYIGIDMPVVF